MLYTSKHFVLNESKKSKVKFLHKKTDSRPKKYINEKQLKHNKKAMDIKILPNF